MIPPCSPVGLLWPGAGLAIIEVVFLVVNSAVVVGWLVFGVITGVAAQMAKQRRGATPWRIHPVLWGLIGVVLGIIGLILCIIAIFTTKPTIPAGYSPPPSFPGSWPPPGPGSWPPPEQAPPPDSTSVPPPTSQPADWYPDPYGRHELRYWDGQSWTSNVSDAGSVSADPPVPS